MSSRLVLFDCDGTLIDSHGAIATAMRLAFVQHRCPPPAPSAVRSLIGLSSDAMVHVLCQDLPDAPEAAILTSYLTLFRREAIISSSVERMVPGMRDVIDELLQDEDTMLGLVTGKAEDTLERALATFSLDAAFTVRATSDDGPSKPAADILLLAVAEAGIPISRTVVVGDTVFDVLMAKAAGAAAVGVTWGAHSADSLRLCGADAVIDHPSQVGAAVDGLVPSSLPQVSLH